MSDAAVDFVKFLGFDLQEDSTVDQMKKWSDETLIKVSAIPNHADHKRILGERLGSNQTSAKSAFKEAGITFTNGQADGFNKMIESGVEQFQQKIKGLEEEVETLRSGSPDKSKELELKIEEIVDLKKTNQDLTTTNTGLVESLKTKEKEVAAGVKEKESFIFQQLRDKAHSKLNLDSNADKLKVRGFYAEMEDNYVTSLKVSETEGGSKKYGLEIRDKSGELVKSPQSHGEHLDYEGVYKQGAAKHNILKVNPDGGKPAAESKNYTPKKDKEDKNENNGKRQRIVATGSSVGYRHR